MVAADLEAFGLSGYEARVLVALLKLGTASASQLGRESGVHRTSTYPVLDALCVKGLAEPLPGKLALWVSAGRDAVLNRLYSLQEDRLRGLQTRLEQTRRLMADLVPESTPATLAHLQLVRGAQAIEKAYERMLASVQRELIVFNRPPYGLESTTISQRVLETLARGVDTRVLYRAVELEAPGADGFRQETAAYIRLGVSAGLVDDLPLKLAVADRRVALVTLVSVEDEGGFPTSLLVENPGFAEAMAAAFEHYWTTARSVAGLLGVKPAGT